MQDAMTKAVSQSDLLDPARARALQVVLNLTPSLIVGDDLPVFFHHLYFWEPLPAGALGRDGHPKTGGLVPDLGLPRRMWAGGKISFRRAPRIGHEAERRSVCEASEVKSGRTGRLGLVTLRHEIRQDGDLCLTEHQNLIYREDPRPDAPKPQAKPAPPDPEYVERVDFDTTLLFRYSALTFNGHRIHYDLDYARDVEGYAGLVVHGPLLAQLLMSMAERRLGKLSIFEFRATSALMHWETADLCQQGNTFWVRGPDGRQCMIATAQTC